MKFILGLVLAIFDPFQISASQGFTSRSDPLLKANLPTLMIYMDYIQYMHYVSSASINFNFWPTEMKSFACYYSSLFIPLAFSVVSNYFLQFDLTKS